MIWLWVGFVSIVLVILTLDLAIFHREPRAMTLREAMVWSGVWILLGLGFSVFVHFGFDHHWFGLGLATDPVDGHLNDGRTASIKYLTGYIVEESLSADNMFVIAMIFRFFGVPAVYQHRVLFWGILGALVMRGAMIGFGVALISHFDWILYVFGVILLFTAVRMLRMGSEHEDPSRNKVLRLARRFFPVTARFHGEHFVVRAGSPASISSAVAGEEALPDHAVNSARQGVLMLTPLALTLIVVETTDIVFAVDSIPAIFAITADPFLVFTSNVFAILGLRSLYSALAGMIDKFRYLKVSLSIILGLIGIKMLTAHWLREILGKNFNFYLLGIVVLILSGGIVASIVKGAREKTRVERTTAE